MLRLRYHTGAEWQAVVLADFDAFLRDHAANERKVAGSALTLAAQYPHSNELVTRMIAIATEELDHFRQVFELLLSRGHQLGPDRPDPYMSQLRKHLRKQYMDEYLLDRLVMFAIVEARGCERFSLVAKALPAGDLRRFYNDLATSEARHHVQYLQLARQHFQQAQVEQRLDALLAAEAEIIASLPLRPALH